MIKERGGRYFMKRCAVSPSGDLYCTCCGKKAFPIMRRTAKQKEGGHLKKLYCVWCQQDKNHVECKGRYTFDDFKCEFENGNFDSSGNRIREDFYSFISEVRFLKNELKKTSRNK